MDSPDDPVVQCDCCDLEVSERLASALTVTGLVKGWRCRKCNEHQGQDVKMAQDHEDDVRIRWGETFDKMVAAEGRADYYEGKMRAAYKSRDSVLAQFDRLSDFHRQTRRGGCSCGVENCPELAVIGADWIVDLISRMRDRQRLR
jgi:hypothetical protein